MSVCVCVGGGGNFCITRREIEASRARIQKPLLARVMNYIFPYPAQHNIKWTTSKNEICTEFAILKLYFQNGFQVVLAILYPKDVIQKHEVNQNTHNSTTHLVYFNETHAIINLTQWIKINTEINHNKCIPSIKFITSTTTCLQLNYIDLNKQLMSSTPADSFFS